MAGMTNSRASRFLPYLLILSGPAGSGKSSVATILWQELPDRPAYLDLDGFNNFIWQAPSDDHHLDLASKNALSVTENYLDSGHSVILDKAFGRYAFVLPFMNAADRRGITVHYFKLTAPLHVLVERNRVRYTYTAEDLVRQARWRPFSAPDENVARIFRFFQENAHPQGREIDTSVVDLQAVIALIRDQVLGESSQT